MSKRLVAQRQHIATRIDGTLASTFSSLYVCLEGHSAEYWMILRERIGAAFPECHVGSKKYIKTRWGKIT